MNRKISIVITDLDNTLFDWADIWYKSFSAMLGSLVSLSGVPRDVLIHEIRQIHQRHATSEYAFLIEEIPSLIRKHPGGDLAGIYADSIDAFRKARASALQLYPTVKQTLEVLKSKGVLVAGYTESMEFYTSYRIRKFDLDGLLDFVYTPPDHVLPEGLTPETIRRHSARTYDLHFTKNRHTPVGELKPNPKLLLDIIRELGGSPDVTVYVGDSRIKDVAMAQAANVTDVWAKYGIAQNRPEYQLLRDVTHWTDEAVQKEKNLTTGEITPSYVLPNSFSEVLSLFDFVASSRDTNSAEVPRPVMNSNRNTA